MRVVFDTSVIVSGLNFHGNEQRVQRLADRGRFELYPSQFIFQEVSGVLARKFNWSQERIAQAIRMLNDSATVVEPRRRLPIIRTNQADNRILACAVVATADFLITGDRRHLLPLNVHEGVRIVNAAVFLSLIER
jgi:putative PIN family toxin of toxin-antitoxin system